MRRRNVTITIVLLVLFAAIFLWSVSEANPLEKRKPEDIKEITISSPSEFFTITKAEDIELLFSALQSIELRRTIRSSKDGFAFLIDLDLENGETIKISILSKDLHMDGHNYRPLKDPCNDIRNVFDSLVEKYVVNPS